MGRGALVEYSEKALEAVLKGYPMLRAQAQLEAEELKHLFPSCISRLDGMPHGSGVSDSTGNYAVKREAWSHNMRRARALEIALEALTVTERDLVRLMYFEQWRLYQIRLRMGTSRAHVFRVRRSALDKIAETILS